MKLQTRTLAAYCGTRSRTMHRHQRVFILAEAKGDRLIVERRDRNDRPLPGRLFVKRKNVGEIQGELFRLPRRPRTAERRASR
ncbi:TPA: hypothetical protein ACK3Q6_004438 [Burkholderia cepacia]